MTCLTNHTIHRIYPQHSLWKTFLTTYSETEVRSLNKRGILWREREIACRYRAPRKDTRARSCTQHPYMHSRSSIPATLYIVKTCVSCFEQRRNERERAVARERERESEREREREACVHGDPAPRLRASSRGARASASSTCATWSAKQAACAWRPFGARGSAAYIRNYSRAAWCYAIMRLPSKTHSSSYLRYAGRGCKLGVIHNYFPFINFPNCASGMHIEARSLLAARSRNIMIQFNGVTEARARAPCCVHEDDAVCGLRVCAYTRVFCPRSFIKAVFALDNTRYLASFCVLILPSYS